MDTRASPPSSNKGLHSRKQMSRPEGSSSKARLHTSQAFGTVLEKNVPKVHNNKHACIHPKPSGRSFHQPKPTGRCSRKTSRRFRIISTPPYLPSLRDGVGEKRPEGSE